MTTEPKTYIGESQCQAVGAPAPKTWDDYEAGCHGTYGGGYRTEEDREIFRHGMTTVFNLLRREFPSVSECKAATNLMSALILCIRWMPVLAAGRKQLPFADSTGHGRKAAGDFAALITRIKKEENA